MYAEGKDAVVVFTNDDVSEPVIDRLAEMGVKFIATRSVGVDHIDKEAAGKYGIKIANVPTPHQAYLTKEALQEISNKTIENLDLWQLNKCVGNACACAKNCRAKNTTDTIKTVSHD